MNTNESRGVSPVVGVILVVAITVALSGVVGAFVFDLGQSVSESGPQSDIATRTTYNTDGTATVQVVTGSADELRVLVNGIEEANATNPRAGTALTVSANPDSSLTVISESDGTSQVVTAETSDAGVLGPRTGLVSYYRMDGDATDSVGSNDGVTNGNVSFAPGTLQQAGGFDGTDAYVHIGDKESLDGFSMFTLSAWVHPTNVTDGHGIVGKWNGGDTWSYYLRVFYGKAHFMIRSGGNTEGVQAGTVTADNWQHITATYDGATARVYINSTLVGSFTHGSPNPSTANVSIGYDSEGDDYFDGRIDDVRIYNQSLTSEEVNDLYNATK